MITWQLMVVLEALTVAVVMTETRQDQAMVTEKVTERINSRYCFYL